MRNRKYKIGNANYKCKDRESLDLVMLNDLKPRTKKIAMDCWVLCSKIPKSREYNAYVNQLIRCSSSVGANYRASQRAKSPTDFKISLK